jgi:translation initiation factor IF-1
MNPGNAQVTGTVTDLLPDQLSLVRLESGARALAVTGEALEHHGSIQIGDQVTLAVPAGDASRGEIVAVHPTASTRSARLRPSLIKGAAAARAVPLRVDPAARPGWRTGVERLPAVGEEVYCTAGVGSVVRILGKTGDGSRLLELRLEGVVRGSFFAAASNVLVSSVRVPSQGS